MSGVLIFDIDGSIIDNKTYISEEYFNEKLKVELIWFRQNGVECIINTARTLEMIENLELFYECGVKYVISEVGYKITLHGVEDEEWSGIVNSLSNESIENIGLFSVIQKELSKVITKYKLITPYYLHIKLNEEVDLGHELIRLKNFTEGNKYQMISDQYKVKYLHKQINKGAALQYIINKRKLEQSYLMGVGDNIIDDMFLDLCNYSLKVQPGTEEKTLLHMKKIYTNYILSLKDCLNINQK